jgi:hypothetical protein
MRKLFTLIASMAIITFAGCSSSRVKATSTAEAKMQGKLVSTFLVGEYVDAKSAEAKLSQAGFEIIASYKSIVKGTTIVFSNADLKREGAKEGRSHAAVLRMFVDAQEKMICITNPVYFGKAYMQDEYNHSLFNAQLESLHEAFAGLNGSDDKILFDDLAGYHFMIGMPYYTDVDELGVGTLEDLVAKAKRYKKGKLLVYELKLSETSTLLGYDLGKRTKKFVKKIGRANAAILPYSISIENGKATSLEAKYYIALNYPLLSMTTFTTIATVPGAITKDLKRPFK